MKERLSRHAFAGVRCGALGWRLGGRWAHARERPLLSLDQMQEMLGTGGGGRGLRHAGLSPKVFRPSRTLSTLFPAKRKGLVYFVILTGTLPAAILLYGAPSSSGLRTDTRARPGHCTHAGFAVLVYTCSRMRVSWTFCRASVAAAAAAADPPADAEVGCHGHVIIARSVWKTRLPNDKTQSPFLPGMSWASWRV